MPGGYRWVRYSGARYVVPGMVTVGHDLDGSCLVVGRAHHQGDILPAKAKPEHGIAYVPYGGNEIMKHDFEVLMPVEFRWVPSRHGQVPHGAVEGGRTSTGETLYVGRTIHNGVPCVGKVHPSHGSLYIPYSGREIPFREYEVLVQH
ncbi:natterin-4-like isoform X1 [Diachasmimorpha longicaudata]|uniref:natterin-4-like isoform X1 n=2 Tax=Diachasmimorpha longicaudata TaxID=58733 RepID=UPI0030B8AF02